MQGVMRSETKKESTTCAPRESWGSVVVTGWCVLVQRIHYFVRYNQTTEKNRGKNARCPSCLASRLIMLFWRWSSRSWRFRANWIDRHKSKSRPPADILLPTPEAFRPQHRRVARFPMHGPIDVVTGMTRIRFTRGLTSGRRILSCVVLTVFMSHSFPPAI
jgi:hypothetical protein